MMRFCLIQQKMRAAVPTQLTRVGLVGMLLMVAACWHSVTVHGTRLVPGQLYLPRIEALALVPIDGPGGAGLEHAIRLQLLRTHAFDVLNGTAIDPRDGRLKDGVAGDKRVALMIGEVLEHEFVDHFDYSQTGPSTRAQTTYSRGGDLVFRAALRFVDATTHKILDSTIVQLQAEMPVETVTVDGPASSDADVIAQYFKPRNTGAIYSHAYQQMAAMLGDQLRGRSLPAKVRLFHPAVSSGFDSHDALAKARAGDWRGAAHIYRTALKMAQVEGKLEDQHRAYLLANIGTCDAMNGALDEAVDMLEAAAALQVSDDIRAQKDTVAGWLADMQQGQKARL